MGSGVIKGMQKFSFILDLKKKKICVNISRLEFSRTISKITLLEKNVFSFSSKIC